ncbi:hypothetical protein AVEN_39801-1, partial [Araneus ventricosus]
MTSHLPLHEWPEDKYYEPITCRQDETLHSHSTGRRRGEHADEYELTHAYRENKMSDKKFCCLKNPSQCKALHRENAKYSTSEEKTYEHATSMHLRDRDRHKSNDDKRFYNSTQIRHSSPPPRRVDNYATYQIDNSKRSSNNENHYYKSSQVEGFLSKPPYEHDDSFKEQHSPRMSDKENRETLRRGRIRTKADRIQEEDFNISIICHCESCDAFYKSLQSPKVENLVRKRPHVSGSSSERTDSSNEAQSNGRHGDNPRTSDDSQANSDESPAIQERRLEEADPYNN